MTEFLQTTIFALATAGVVAVGAVGLTLSYGVTRFINFSYGDLLTWGAFLAYAFVMWVNLPLTVAALAAAALVGVATIVIARLAFDPLRPRGPVPLLITSVGVAFVLQNLVLMAFGSNPKRFPLPLLRPWQVGELFVPPAQVLILAVSIVVMVLVHLLLKHTFLGKMMRATSDNEALARVSGVRARRVIALTWGISGTIAGLAGVLLAMTQVTIQPTMGWSFLLVIFAATLLGGIGRPYGAMLGALIVGVGVEFGTTYLAPNYGFAVAFAILVGVLLIRPEGLRGGIVS